MNYLTDKPKLSRKEYYRQYEYANREKRNARKRELYREKRKKQIEEEIRLGIPQKRRKERTTFKTLFKALLKEIYSEDFNSELLEQVVLRYAYSMGYVELKGDNFNLTEKGIELTKE